MLGAVGPIVAPANDDVATGKRVAVIAEIPALEFKLDVHALPALRSNLALGFAVRESRLHGFDDVAQFFGDQPKEKHDTLFVDRRMAQAPEVDGVAISWVALERRVPDLCARHESGRQRPLLR